MGDARVLDIRESHETQLRFRAAIKRPKSAAAQWIDSLDPDMTYILVCQSGKRSLTMVTDLRERGMGRAYSYFGGMNRAIKAEDADLMEVIQPCSPG
ncbi:rhodanese-like domain-containing protein [Candidatus Sororendozoicomonas aggregata]|uniref:rhodanese-like domain-containing protein n=1 Tax=Candidatus Sororendozoicomonas aggregata TaxID=3073239 RepID=UPI002ED5D728